MGSSTKKHKSKDRDDKDKRKKKSHKEPDVVDLEPNDDSSSRQGSKRKKHGTNSSPIEIEDSPIRHSNSSSNTKIDDKKEENRDRKPSSRRHKDKKRRHSGSDDSDSNRSPPKKAKDAHPPRPKPAARSPSPPKPSSAAGDTSLSIEESNKIRLKLGLKPLQVDSAPVSRPPPPKKDRTESVDSRESGELDEERIKAERELQNQTFWKQDNSEFVHAPAANITEQKQAEKLREKLQTRRDKRQLEEKLLKAKGLADDSDDDDSAAKWVEKSKKLAEEKALAEKRAKALQELDDEFGVGDLVDSEFQKVKNKAYGSKNLKGMKVVHSQERLTEGESVIMTLQDKGVLDEEDDVLMNVNLVDDEKYEKNIENRRLRPELHGYNAFDDQEDPFHEKKVLAKYDEEIDGEKKKSFVIGEDNTEAARKAKLRTQMQKANKILESIEAPALRIASDFLTPEEMTFKKRTKKVRKVRKVLRADDLLFDGPDASQDLGSRKSKNAGEAKPGIKAEPVDMEIDMDVDDGPVPQSVDVSDIKLEDEGDLDFQLALSKARKLKQKEKMKKQTGIEKIAELVRAERDHHPFEDRKVVDSSMTLNSTAEFCRTLGDIPSFSSSDLYADEQMDFETEEAKIQREEEERGKWNTVPIDDAPIDVIKDTTEVDETPILEQEPELGGGIAGALKLAMKKGFLEQEKQKRLSARTMKHLEAKNYSIEDKNYDEDRNSKREMYSGPSMDFKEKNHYKPEVKLEYTDEDGRSISAKEAFRLLSHKFHGKGSGKNKIDKKRRKADQDKLMQHMSSTDTPLGTLELLQERQKASNSAYVVLTGSKASQNTLLSKAKR